MNRPAGPWQDTPLGVEAREYLRLKSKRLTKSSQRMYEAALACLARIANNQPIRALTKENA